MILREGWIYRREKRMRPRGRIFLAECFDISVSVRKNEGS
jgi:hypothetical protein